MKSRPQFSTWLTVALWASAAFAQGLDSLKTVKIPEPPNLDRYVRGRAALVVLGKALFWDMQVGSDGRTACATCHFHAGADHRAQNQFSNPDGPLEANHQQVWEDFPFRVFSNPDDNHSPLVRDSSQRAGSAGVVRRSGPGADIVPPPFQAGGLNVRQVTPRNTPTVINAVFHVRAFRDGRASGIFTGRTPFGDSDP